VALRADAKTLQELPRQDKVRRPWIALPAKGMMAQGAMPIAIFDHSMPTETNRRGITGVKKNYRIVAWDWNGSYPSQTQRRMRSVR
jgi:hypothetical protein